MASKYIGLACVVSVDVAGGSSFAVCAQVVDFDAPGRERHEISDACLDSTLEVNDVGLEKASQFKFRIKRDGADTVHQGLYTLFGSKATATWKLTMTDTKLHTFSGKVSAYQPQKVVHDKHVEDEITVNRTSAITIT